MRSVGLSAFSAGRVVGVLGWHFFAEGRNVRVGSPQSQGARVYKSAPGKNVPTAWGHILTRRRPPA